jgi:uncharacterized protein YkwD
MPTTRVARAARPWLVVALVLTMLLPATAPAAEARSLEPSLEQQLTDLINRERRAAGRPALSTELQLTRIARDWSGTMADAGRLSHRPDLGGEISGAWRRTGENVGVGPSLTKMHDAFMASPGHAENVLGDYDRVGVGVIEDGGRLWVTVNFVRGSGEFPLFTDIRNNAHRSNIEALFRRGTTAGCRSDRYCPGDDVTRAQMATFLARELGLASEKADFRDVPREHPHAGAIGALAASGITAGCGPQRFCPNDTIDRGQMATFLRRALALTERPPSGVSDVLASSIHSGSIGALQLAGITQGCTTTTFCPTAPVSRGQMASFLSRAFG